jgi:hypothetical protein
MEKATPEPATAKICSENSPARMITSPGQLRGSLLLLIVNRLDAIIEFSTKLFDVGSNFLSDFSEFRNIGFDPLVNQG